VENRAAIVRGRRYGARMRWDHLFDDLAGQLEHELTAEEADLRQEEERLRLGRLSLRERVLALKRTGDPALALIRFVAVTGRRHSVRPLTVGRDWMAGDLDERPDTQGVVPFSAIGSLELSQQQSLASLDAPPAAPDLSSRLGLAFLLRDLCRRRVTVHVETSTGTMSGTIDRVGRDHLDLAEHDADRPRRASEVRGVRVIGLDQVVLVRL
jgi:hypothetical protein